MGDLKVEKEIPAPMEAVFERITDFASAPQRVEAITKVEMLTDGEVGLGTRFRETRIMFGREASEEMEVTAFERPNRYELGAESHGTKYRTELRLEPASEGTKVIMTFRAEPVSLFSKFMNLLLARAMRNSVAKAVKKDLDDLAATFG